MTGYACSGFELHLTLNDCMHVKAIADCLFSRRWHSAAQTVSLFQTGMASLHHTGIWIIMDVIAPTFNFRDLRRRTSVSRSARVTARSRPVTAGGEECRHAESCIGPACSGHAGFGVCHADCCRRCCAGVTAGSARTCRGIAAPSSRCPVARASAG